MFQGLLRNEAFRLVGRLFRRNKRMRFTSSPPKTVNSGGTSGRIVKHGYAMDFGRLAIEQQGKTVRITLEFLGPYEAIVYYEDFTDCMRRGGVRMGFEGTQIEDRERVTKG